MDEREEIDRICGFLAEGKTILYPTDTIAGLGCDATSDDAVSKISKLKNRQAGKSFIILVSSDAMLNKFVPEIPAIAWDLIDVADKPLTIVYPKGHNLSNLAVAEDGSVAVRMVKEGFCHRLIQKFGKPIVSTSANVQAENPPQILEQVSPFIRESVDFIVSAEFWENTNQSASSILKLNEKGQIKIIRK